MIRIIAVASLVVSIPLLERLNRYSRVSRSSGRKQARRSDWVKMRPGPLAWSSKATSGCLRPERAGTIETVATFT